ncbi:hypothetical protein SAY87_024496 [Trapa incisa]|uniref:Uncharacterized protein n=1 Tax=Trapa incisa TaxID=236973 RepID=A0AAN7GC36_9MYRT|nr:hypothetical protein SAY87_024496 [Trapa incisa]
MEEALLEDALHLHPVYPGLPWSPDSERHCIIVERGARYRAYSELRESKLRMKHLGFGKQQEQGKEVEDRDFKLTPVRKQVRFQLDSENLRGPSSILAQSVPDFSSTLRKENRKPSNRAFELTPPSKIGARVNSFGANARGSKSASAGEKKRGGLMTRRSCANLDELKGLATAARNAIKVHHPNNFRRQIDLANGLQ